MDKQVYRQAGQKLWVLVTSLAAAAACIGYQFWLGSTQTSGGALLTRYASQILLRGGETRYSYAERGYFCTLLFYLQLTPMALFGYCLLVLRPRRLGPRTGGQKKAAAAVLAGVAALALLAVPPVFEGVIPNASWAKRWAVDLYMVLLLLHAVLTVAGVLCILATERKGRRHRAPPAPAREAKRYGLCFVLAGPMLVSTACITSLMGERWTGGGYTWQAESPFAITALVLFAPLMEECFFRGILSGRLGRCFPSPVAAVLSALCFGVWHGNMVAFVYTLVPGLAFAALYHKTGRLRYGMLAHLLNNLLLMLQGPPQSSLLPSLRFLLQWREKLFRLPAPAAAAVLAASLAVTALLIWKLFPAQPRPAAALPGADA